MLGPLLRVLTIAPDAKTAPEERAKLAPPVTGAPTRPSPPPPKSNAPAPTASTAACASPRKLPSSLPLAYAGFSPIHFLGVDRLSADYQKIYLHKIIDTTPQS